jgi:hypothetical protein
MCKSTFLLPLCKPVRDKNRESTPAGGSGGPRFPRLGRLEPWTDGGKEGGVVGNSETCSPWRGGDGRVAAGGVQRRPVAVSRGGGAPVCFRPWEGWRMHSSTASISWWCWLGSKVNGSGKTWAAAASSAMADSGAALQVRRRCDTAGRGAGLGFAGAARARGLK